MLKSAKSLTKFTAQEQNWAMLISQVAEGNESAFSALYDGTSQLVYGLALRILADRAEAEEVITEVYIQVWHKAADYKPDTSTASAWLLMLTRSRAIDRFRSNAKRKKVEESLEWYIPTTLADPERAALAVEQRQFIQNALSKLTPEQRRVIELAYFFGLSQSEIAAQLDQPLGTVKSWVRVGMIKLHELLTLKEAE